MSPDRAVILRQQAEYWERMAETCGGNPSLRRNRFLYREKARVLREQLAEQEEKQ